MTYDILKRSRRVSLTVAEITDTAWRAEHGADHDYLPVVADMLAGQFNSPWRRK